MARGRRMLFTGGAGFVGRNILPRLCESFDIIAPRRSELNLLNEDAVRSFVTNGGFDIVVHAANTTPAKNPLDKDERMLSDSLRAYFNLRRCSGSFGRMFYFGSGAEFDKRFEIASVCEEDLGRTLPVDDYGLAKFIMNEDARRSENIVNLRIFGCFGPTDAKSKFIRDAIDCCLGNRAITIRQDCMFDYMYVADIVRVIEVMADAELRHHDYNICTGRRTALSEIAAEVARQMGNSRPLEIARPGWNREYTASNARLVEEFPGLVFTSLEDGIARQVAWQKEYME